MEPSLSYAVVFKTYYWDDFVESQFRQLQSRAGTDDVYIVVDETHGPVAGIMHDKVLRLTEAMSEAEGFFRYPKGKMFWYNSDYLLLHFTTYFPEFEYIVASEQDVSVKVDIRPIVRAMAAEGLAFVGDPIRTPKQEWQWFESTLPYYDADLDFFGRLVCFTIFNRSFAMNLLMARNEHLRRLRAGEFPFSETEKTKWPTFEAFAGAEIARLNFAEKPLSAFADTSHYDWWPPYHPSQIEKLTSDAICHPVLTGDRLVKSLLRYPDRFTPELWLEPSSELRARLDYESPDIVIPALLAAFLKSKNADAVAILWLELRRLGPKEQLFSLAETLSQIRKVGERANIALGKFAIQSSISQWSHSHIPYEDAANAVNGSITGDYAFHTSQEFRPWWTVDLGSLALVSEIVLFNRMPDKMGRANNLSIWSSLDARNWTLLHHHVSSKPFGGVDGNPLQVVLSEKLPARFIRIEVFGQGILHLDEVQIFGNELARQEG